LINNNTLSELYRDDENNSSILLSGIYKREEKVNWVVHTHTTLYGGDPCHPAGSIDYALIGSVSLVVYNIHRQFRVYGSSIRTLFFFFLGPQIALTCALLFWVCPVIKSFFFSSKGGMIENMGNLLANEQVVRLILCRLFNWAKGNVVVVLVVEYEAESILCVYWAQKRLRFPLPFLFYKPL